MDEADLAQRSEQMYLRLAMDDFRLRQSKISNQKSTICAECGEEIPEARRKAMPGCRLCIVCARWAEKKA